jgi:hypothetical protein
MLIGDRAKLEAILEKIVVGGYDPVEAIVESEQARGYRVIRPGDATWFPLSDWEPVSVSSINGDYARLVLLHAIVQGRGALTRALAAIEAGGLIAQVIDPTRELASTLRRRGWRGRKTGRSFEDREEVWQRH